MRFADGSPDAMEYIVKSGADVTRTGRYSDDVGMSEFLSRPIKIDTRDWVVGANTHHTFDPWTLFFTNKRIVNRLNNYNLLRATLKVKFVINGNGFYYGRAIASYLPLATWDDFSQNRSLVKQDIVAASQQPHVYLDPTTSTGGVLSLPFFYYYDFINPTDGGWSSLGEITLRSINELIHANGGTDSVTITTFAWAEDVQLAVPTSIDAIGLVPQADLKLGGDETDEANAKGIVSGPATAISSAAAKLKSIPALSPYASATEIGASMVASVAKTMGYSRPPVTRAPEPVQPHNVSSMALCTVPDVTNKLSVDDKQGLGMGSEISGIMSDDPLSILNIARRESYVTTFDWPVTAAPDDLIWNTRVHPAIHAEYAGVSPPELHLPALAVAALPFEYWTGTINIRFQIVCSAFHRGRLRVVYDPNYLALNPEYNVNYQEIIDLSEKQDFTVSISNSQERGVMPIPRVAVENPALFIYSATRFPNYRPSNGVVGLYVVNELVTPNTVATSDVQINMFVSGGEDFKVFSPYDDISHYEFKPQADLDFSKVTDDAQASAPVSEQTEPLSIDKHVPDEITSVYAGECIGSFRQLIRRYNKHSTLTSFSGTGLNVYTARRNSFPYFRGNVAGAVDSSLAGPYNYAWTSVLQYITLCFAGWRGGIRHRIVPAGVAESDSRLLMVAKRSAADGYDNDIDALTAPSSLNVARYNGIVGAQARSCPHGSEGMALTTAVVNDVLSFEVPYQKYYRFAPAKYEDLTASDAWCNAFEVSATCDAKNDGWLDWYVAAGEDYQVYFWTGMPPLYYDITEPSPTP